MDSNLLPVVALIGVALIFDYINGFHDAANSIATVVSTRVRSKTASGWKPSNQPSMSPRLKASRLLQKPIDVLLRHRPRSISRMTERDPLSACLAQALPGGQTRQRGQ